MFLPNCLSNSEDRLACIADLQVVHADRQDHSHQRLGGRLCISLTACTHRSIRITTSFCSSEAKNVCPCYKRQIAFINAKYFLKYISQLTFKRGTRNSYKQLLHKFSGNVSSTQRGSSHGDERDHWSLSRRARIKPWTPILFYIDTIHLD